MKIYEHETYIRKMFESREQLMPACMIEYNGEKGVVFKLGENLASGTWLSGDIIVFWEGGDYTMLPNDGKYKIIKKDLWEAIL